jgi:glycosidase
MRFWLEKGVDGFRCDAAAEVPAKFWKGILPKMKADYPEMFLLAEAESTELIDPKETFDASYAWKLHHLMNDIAQGKKTAADLKTYIAEDDAEFGKTNFRMMFTSNHDENSWSGSEFERMGDAANAMAVLCFTLPKGQPLVYTGQEVGVTRRIEFFEKDPVTDWSANKYTEFFKSLIKFRHDNARTLAPGEQGAPIRYIENDNPNVFAFSRGEGKDKVVVIVNLSSEPASATIKLDGKYYSAFGGQEYSSKAESFELGAWQYCLMSKKK